MILLYFLISKQDLIKHVNADLYICNIQEGSGQRRPRACGLNNATDWILEPDGNLRAPLIIRNPDMDWPEVWDINMSNNQLILFLQHGEINQQFTFAHQGRLGGNAIKKGGRCITYNDATNTYSLEVCGQTDNQRFEVLPDFRNNNEPEFPIDDISPIYDEPEQVDIRTGKVVRRARRRGARPIPSRRGPERIGNPVGEWTCPGKKSGIPGTVLNTAPPLRTQQGMNMGSGSLMQSGSRSVLTEMEMSKSRTAGGSISGEGVTGPNMCNMGFLH